MAALTLTKTVYRNPVSIQTLRLVTGVGSFAGRDLPKGPDQLEQQSQLDLPESPALKAFYRLCGNCLLQENYYLEQPEALREIIQAFSRQDLLKLACWTREELGLNILPLLLLAEASVRYNQQTTESKQDVRQMVAKLVQNGSEATQLLAWWLMVCGAGSKQKLPNSLKKGLCEALANMSAKQLLQGPWVLPMADLLRMVHAKPRSAEQSAVWAKVLKGELLAEVKTFQDLSLNLALREQTELEELQAELIQAQLSPLQCLMLEREAETAELKTILRQKLLQTRLAPAACQLNHQTALFVDTGAGLTRRLAKQPALQLLDIGAMLAALAGPEVQIGAFATEARWIKARVNLVETALRLRQAELGWSSQAWKAIAKLKGSGIQQLVIFSAGEPTAEVLACWQRYLSAQPQAMLCWVDVSAECAEQAELVLPADNSRIIKILGWSEHLMTLISLLRLIL